MKEKDISIKSLLGKIMEKNKENNDLRELISYYKQKELDDFANYWKLKPDTKTPERFVTPKEMIVKETATTTEDASEEYEYGDEIDRQK